MKAAGVTTKFLVMALVLSWVGYATAADLFVADQDALGGGGAILRVDTRTGDQAVISSGGFFSHPTALVFLGKDLIVADQDAVGSTGAIIRVDVRSGQQTVISSGGNFINPGGITVDAHGTLIVADRESAKIIAVVPATGDQTVISSAGVLVSPISVVVDRDGTLVVADQDSGGAPAVGLGAVVRVDPQTGGQQVISAGGLFVNPRGVVIDNHGFIIVADGNTSGGGALLQVDP